MIKIKNDLNLASQVFNLLLADGTVERITNNMPELLDYANVETAIIGNAVRDYKQRFQTEVKVYRPWNRWFSSAYATTYTGNFNYIGINQYKMNRSLASLVGSIGHEWGHCLEYFTKTQKVGYYFNHGDNSPVGKDLTFQYMLGRRLKAYVTENENELLRRLAVIV